MLSLRWVVRKNEREATIKTTRTMTGTWDGKQGGAVRVTEMMTYGFNDIRYAVAILVVLLEFLIARL